MADAVVGRIGRTPAPGEAAVQRLRERPDVLEYMARTEFASELGFTPVEADARWVELSDRERAARIDRTFASLSDGARSYDETHPVGPPDPDDGGQGLPIDDTSIARSA